MPCFSTSFQFIVGKRFFAASKPSGSDIVSVAMETLISVYLFKSYVALKSGILE